MRKKRFPLGTFLPCVTVGFGPLLQPEVAKAARDAIAPLWRSRGLEPPLWAGLHRDLYVDPCHPALQIADIHELPAVAAMRPGGSTASDAARPPDWLTRIDGELVYVTFETLWNRESEAVDLMRLVGHKVIGLVESAKSPRQGD